MPITTTQRAALRKNIVAKAVSHIGDHEIGTSNTGPEVNLFQQYVGLGSQGGYSWCMAFAVYIVGKTAEGMGLKLSDTNLTRTGSCQAQADHVKPIGRLILSADVLAGNAAVSPGDLMLQYEGGAYHHTGIVETPPSQHAPMFGTIEGNSNTSGSANGTEVVRQHRDARQSVEGHPRYAFVRTC